MYIETQDGECARLNNGVYKLVLGDHKHGIKTYDGVLLGTYKRDIECQEVYKSLLDAIRLDKKYFKIPKDSYVPKESFVEILFRCFERTTGIIKCNNCGNVLVTFSNEKYPSLPGETIYAVIKNTLEEYENRYCPKCDALFKNSKQEKYKHYFNEEV